MTVLIKIIQVILALSILVIVHEFGHFIASRIFGVRVEKFYMFFDWKFSIFRCKKINGKWRFKFFCKNEPEKYITHEHIDPVTKKKSYTYEPIDLDSLPDDDWRKYDEGTEFGLGWVPLGGYCKIAGMVDESMDAAQMAQEPKPWEFRTKPAWQRLIIMIGGVCMNVILAFVIYIGLLSSYGEQYLPTAEVNKYGITVDSLAFDFGLRDGDKVLTVNGDVIENFSQIPMAIVLDEAQYIEVERDGRTVKVEFPEDATKRMLKENKGFIGFRMPFVVEEVAQGSPAESAGVMKDDRIIAVNGISTPYFNDFKVVIGDFRNQDIDLTLLRDNDTIVKRLSMSDEAVIGVVAKQMMHLATQEYTFWESIPRGFKKTCKEISDYWKQVKLIFTPSTGAYESIGGFITIGSIFPDTFVWELFWRMTALLSIILAVMNLLPIPGLDGGHVLFLLWEVITRRKPSDKFLEKATMIGFLFLMLLLIYANGNDIIRLFK